MRTVRADPRPEGPIAHPQQNLDAQLRYTGSYTYDRVGNILSMDHAPAGGVVSKRGDLYAEDGKRLLKTSLPGDDPTIPRTFSGPYAYDVHGNMTTLAQLPGGLTWDSDDRLQQSGHLVTLVAVRSEFCTALDRFDEESA